MKEDRILDAMMDNRLNKADLIAEARSNWRNAIGTDSKYPKKSISG